MECGIFALKLYWIIDLEQELLLKSKVSEVNTRIFDQLAMEVYLFQYNNNKIYRQFCDAITRSNDRLRPPYFLPIETFKTHVISTRKEIGTHYFESSGTTGLVNSKHYVDDVEFYLRLARKGFESAYGPLEKYSILALLPHYLERNHSSLLAMIDDFIAHSRPQKSGYFLDNHQELYTALINNKNNGIPTILFGVSFALLDFVEKYQLDFPQLIVFETGGMKGRREELTKNQLHYYIKNAFNVQNVHSEYGMTELLSQAWSPGEGVFYPTATMKVVIREATDPFTVEKTGKAGVVHIIDLANVETCSFIATQDLGIDHGNNSFSILGRVAAADLRGCNLMVE